ncbi:MAG: hypothetical protein HQL17_04820 [Candidatus Omnitrophica bacterium]|nr:hypothetical protein [Candidatus Omnitrophota bacterium]
MARDNFSYSKHQRELGKKKKAEEKKQKKLDRKAQELAPAPEPVPTEKIDN